MMGDEDLVRLNNICADLVGMAKNEPFPLYLLRCKAGEWFRVRDISREVELSADEVTDQLFVTWLPDPMAEEGYSVIMFYDAESMWSTAAHYNRQRVLGPAEEKKTERVSKSA